MTYCGTKYNYICLGICIGINILILISYPIINMVVKSVITNVSIYIVYAYVLNYTIKIYIVELKMCKKKYRNSDIYIVFVNNNQ